MNETSHIVHLLSDYLDGALNEATLEAVQRHLDACDACRQEHAQLRVLLDDLHRLPGRIEPDAATWNAIERRLQPSETPKLPAFDDHPKYQHERTPRALRHRLLDAAWKKTAASVIVLIVAVGGFLAAGTYRAWNVTALDGLPRIDRSAIHGTDRLHKGQWLATDETSRASLTVGRIGHVEVAPGTRVRLQNAGWMDHRLNLAIGSIHARIWAPPRLFFVETPAGLAIDLGCEYTLDVDSTGASRLHVLSGYVSFAAGSREVVVPAGWLVNARPGRYTGTPYAASSSPALRAALERFDFESNSTAAIDAILLETGPNDALTVWELIWHARESERPRIYDRLVELAPPPAGVTRTGVLQRDEAMIEAWREKLGVKVGFWLSSLKKKGVY